MTVLALFFYYLGYCAKYYLSTKKRLLTSSMTRTFFVAHVPPPRARATASFSCRFFGPTDSTQLWCLCVRC